MKYLQSAIIKQSAIRPGVPTQGHFMETKQLPVGRDGDRRPPPGSLSPVLSPHGLSPVFLCVPAPFSCFARPTVLLCFLISVYVAENPPQDPLCTTLPFHYPLLSGCHLCAPRANSWDSDPVHPSTMSHPWVRCLYKQLSARRQGSCDISMAPLDWPFQWGLLPRACTQRRKHEWVGPSKAWNWPLPPGWPPAGGQSLWTLPRRGEGILDSHVKWACMCLQTCPPLPPHHLPCWKCCWV